MAGQTECDKYLLMHVREITATPLVNTFRSSFFVLVKYLDKSPFPLTHLQASVRMNPGSALLKDTFFA